MVGYFGGVRCSVIWCFLQEALITSTQPSPMANWEFPKIRGTLFGGTLFGGPYNKDPTIQGTILGSPIIGNSQLVPKSSTNIDDPEH